MKHVLRALSGWLIQQDAIETDDRELYEYAMCSFLVSVMPLAIFLLVSGVMEMLLEGILIVTPFIITRKFSGGYHAKHAYTCMMLSLGLLSCSFCVVIHAECNLFFHILTVISGLSVIINSPIDSENKKLVEDEINQYRHITCLLIIITMVLYFVLVVLRQKHYALCLAVSIVMVAILQVPCVVKNRK